MTRLADVMKLKLLSRDSGLLQKKTKKNAEESMRNPVSIKYYQTGEMVQFGEVKSCKTCFV